MFRNIVYSVCCACVLFSGANAMDRQLQSDSGRLLKGSAPVGKEDTLKIKTLTSELRYYIIHGIITDENQDKEDNACKLAQQMYAARVPWATEYTRCKTIFG
ncbi:MAG: hypothetical protein LBF57_03350, partial [Holosporaceae bacterium]|nr:hypothetical protein [Holosporaceae bacterium]